MIAGCGEGWAGWRGMVSWHGGGFCEEGTALRGPELSEGQTWPPLKQMDTAALCLPCLGRELCGKSPGEPDSFISSTGGLSFLFCLFTP